MLLLSILLIPVMLAAAREFNFGKYVVTINENNTLTGIERTSNDSLPEVNLSNLGLENIDTNAFYNVTNIRRLNLANNWLTTLPEYIFSNFTNLESLSLADNNISSLDRVVIGLIQLQTLDLSNNQFKHIGESYLYGLSIYVDVLTTGNILANISTSLFERTYSPREKKISENKSEVAKNLTTNDFTYVQVCMNKDHLKFVEVLEPGTDMTPNCAKLQVNHTDLKLTLRNRLIYLFEKDWYRVKNLPVKILDLAHLRIGQLAPEILNDLPENIVEVDLSNNTIDFWKAGIIKNWYLRTLILEHDSINKIDDDFLVNTNLSVLSLNYNNLYNTDFAKTLPLSLEEIRLSHNRISVISPGSLSRLKKLVKLDLSANLLINVEPGVFQNFRVLRELNLYQNMINLHKGIFAGLESIEYLNIGRNGLKSITKNTLFAMPDTLKTVILDSNGIQSLGIGSFVRVPKYKLSLAGNNITTIAKGCFDLPSLEELNLSNNRLTKFDSNSFKGLTNVTRLSLANNEITKLPKGDLMYLFSLEVLDLSLNPIKELTRGALRGMVKSQNGAVILSNVPLDHIEGTIFEDTF